MRHVAWDDEDGADEARDGTGDACRLEHGWGGRTHRHEGLRVRVDGRVDRCLADDDGLWQRPPRCSGLPPLLLGLLLLLKEGRRGAQA